MIYKFLQIAMKIIPNYIIWCTIGAQKFDNNMPKNNKKTVDNRRWPGVLSYESEVKRFQGKPDICYYIRYTLPDRRKRTEKVGWKSESYSPQVAAEIRADRLRKARHGEEVKTAREIAIEKQLHDRTIDEIKEAYFSSTAGKKLKGRLTDMNRYDLHIQPIVGNRPVSSLAPLDIDRIKSKMSNHAPATIANTIELLRRLINFGTKKKLCSSMDFKIRVPKVDNEVTEYLEPEEIRRLLYVLNLWPSHDVARMLKMAMLTGVRRGEIFKLKDTDLDFNLQIITLREPKGKKTVTIPMSEPVKGLLEIQLKWRQEKFPQSSYVFPGRKGKKRSDCSAVRRIKKEAGLKNSFRIFHGLRHHFAVTLANSGEFSLDMIGELLTHKDIKMTKRYGQFLPGTMKKASNMAANLVLGKNQSNTADKTTRNRSPKSNAA
jgi:integrase